MIGHLLKLSTNKLSCNCRCKGEPPAEYSETVRQENAAGTPDTELKLKDDLLWRLGHVFKAPFDRVTSGIRRSRWPGGW